MIGDSVQIRAFIATRGGMKLAPVILKNPTVQPVVTTWNNRVREWRRA